MYMITIVFFFNDTATTEIYTLSLHDALPICAATPRISSIAAEASSPERLASAIASLARFCSPRRPSTSGSTSRPRASSASPPSTIPPGTRRRSRPSRTASGSSRISLRSSTGRPAARLLARARRLAALRRRFLGLVRLGRLAAGVALDEQRHVLGVAADDDVRGHERAGEAAVADREQHVVAVLLA